MEDIYAIQAKYSQENLYLIRTEGQCNCKKSYLRISDL